MVNLECLTKNIKGCMARFAWSWNVEIDFRKFIVTPENKEMLFHRKVQR